MIKKYLNYTDADIIKYAKEVKSIAQLLKALNLKAAGGNYANIKRKIQKLNINTDHWTGQGWSKDKQLKDFSEYSKIDRLKPHIIKERGYKCESCDLTEWLSEPIVLELHHINGDRCNNNRANLQLLCPNCHSMTHNWRNRKTRQVSPRPVE